MPSWQAKQQVKPRIYCFLSFDNSFWQKQGSSRKSYILVLKCTDDRTPPPKYIKNHREGTRVIDLIKGFLGAMGGGGGKRDSKYGSLLVCIVSMLWR